MTNRNAETLTHLYAARTALTAYRQSLDTANAATQPSAKLTVLYAVRDRHADYLAALKRGDYIYRDGKNVINTKLGFDFEKTVADSGADKWDVWQKVEPLPTGNINVIGNALQVQFPTFIEAWRVALIVQINAILQSKLPGLTPVPGWTGRNYLYVLTARVALELCANQNDAAFRTCLAGSTVAEFETVLRDWYIAQIRAVVGNDFDSSALDIDKLVARYVHLENITDLRDIYGIDPTGANDGETLGEWFSSASVDLSRITTLQQAVMAATAVLQTEITSWSDTNIGNLRGIPSEFISAYLKNLRPPPDGTSSSPEAAFRHVVADGGLLPARLAPTKYALDPTKLFGYLYGWDYAKFARRVIQIDWDIYKAISNAGFRPRLWNQQNWLPTSTVLLRTDWNGFQNTFQARGIVSVDPVHSLPVPTSPADIFNEWLLWVENGNSPGTVGRPECPGSNGDLCPRATSNCHRTGAYNLVHSNRTALSWAGSPRGSNDLPFFPSSIITGCTPARRSLARGTIALWAEIGIYQDYEEVTRLVNLLEHGDALPDETARQALFQYLHHIYHTTQTILAPREVEYVAGMTSIILEYNNSQNQDERTYDFLIKILTPVAQLADVTEYANGYATESLGNFTWTQYDPSLYTTELQYIISQGANRTFGSSEFNNLTTQSQNQLIGDNANGTGVGGWTEFYPLV
ncbi:MAG: hypothetical protein SGI73_01040, partial [Chloroflexota bacterium]|nr:hypothetical protein [Chloroflexota bacterium]